jgi:hypothetical protein
MCKTSTCLCAELIKFHVMKAYVGMDVQIHVFLTSVLVRDEWSASRPGRLNPRKQNAVPIKQDAGWAPKEVSVTGRGEHS